MTITVTDPDAALDGLACQVDQLLGMDPAEWTLDRFKRAVLDVHASRAVPRVCGPGSFLSTDPCAHEKMSHPRTNVRSEGRRS